MQVILKYQAVDGVEHTTERECIDYELELHLIKDAFGKLKTTPKEGEHYNMFQSGDYIQQDVEEVRKVRFLVLKTLSRHTDHHKWISQTIEQDLFGLDLQGVGRLSDDVGIKFLKEGIYRLMSITKEGKEYNQPYYTRNPEPNEKLIY
jgi:hypothetical protein